MDNKITINEVKEFLGSMENFIDRYITHYVEWSIKDMNNDSVYFKSTKSENIELNIMIMTTGKENEIGKISIKEIEPRFIDVKTISEYLIEYSVDENDNVEIKSINRKDKNNNNDLANKLELFNIILKTGFIFNIHE